MKEFWCFRSTTSCGLQWASATNVLDTQRVRRVSDAVARREKPREKHVQIWAAAHMHVGGSSRNGAGRHRGGSDSQESCITSRRTVRTQRDSPMAIQAYSASRAVTRGGEMKARARGGEGARLWPQGAGRKWERGRDGAGGGSNSMLVEALRPKRSSTPTGDESDCKGPGRPPPLKVSKGIMQVVWCRHRGPGRPRHRNPNHFFHLCDHRGRRRRHYGPGHAVRSLRGSQRRLHGRCPQIFRDRHGYWILRSRRQLRHAAALVQRKVQRPVRGQAPAGGCVRRAKPGRER